LERKLAIFLSYLFHPLWMPFYMVLLLFWMNLQGAVITSIQAWMYIALVVIINTLLLPVLLIYLLKRMKIIQSMSLENKQDRLFPFFIAGLFYFTTWFVFNSLNIFPFLEMVFIISTTLVLLAAIINMVWKISIHNMSMGAVSMAVLFLTASHYILSPWPVYFAFILAGLVGFARLKLKSHTPAQIYSGFLLGALVVVFFVFIG